MLTCVKNCIMVISTIVDQKAKKRRSLWSCLLLNFFPYLIRPVMLAHPGDSSAYRIYFSNKIWPILILFQDVCQRA